MIVKKKNASNQCRKWYPKGTKMKPKRSKRAPKEGQGAKGWANMGPIASKPQKTSSKPQNNLKT